MKIERVLISGETPDCGRCWFLVYATVDLIPTCGILDHRVELCLGRPADCPLELEQVHSLSQARMTELESENKALKLIAGSHSMSELRRLKTQLSYGSALERASETEVKS